RELRNGQGPRANQRGLRVRLLTTRIQVFTADTKVACRAYTRRETRLHSGKILYPPRPEKDPGPRGSPRQGRVWWPVRQPLPEPRHASSVPSVGRASSSP